MLENIEIVDYKCFKDFKLDGLSRINIISGGNNVGKTALLEAVYLMSNIGDLNYFLTSIKDIYQNRELSLNSLEKYFAELNLSFKIDNKNIKIKHTHLNELKKEYPRIVSDYHSRYNNFIVSETETTINIFPYTNLISETSNNYPENRNTYINSTKPTNKDLVQLYSYIQTKGIQHKFLEYLQILDSSISSIEPQLVEDELYLRINLKNPQISLLSSELGEGTNRFIEILTSLLKNSNSKIVLIDEIENGIHHSKLKDIWKAIIEIVQKEDIQLFVTTHDSDTIETLVDASKELEFKEITSVRLIKDNQNKIQPIIMNYENLLFGTDIGEDFR
ncbi:MAG: AAA family ATPase [Campylobacterota bacterium]|nr:AAA family ATPase [Campylobacterota bacterium]